MSSKTIKAFEKHTGRRSPGAQGVTFRDAAKPGLGPSKRSAAESQGLCADCGMSGFAHKLECPFWERETRHAVEAQESDWRAKQTLPPPPASVEVACLLARAQELEDTARMMLARAAELRHVAAAASESKPEPEPGPRFRSRFEFKHQ